MVREAADAEAEAKADGEEGEEGGDVCGDDDHDGDDAVGVAVVIGGDEDPLAWR